MLTIIAVHPAAAFRGDLAAGATTRCGLAVHAALSSGGPV
jgi:hypothetical protein